MNMSLIQSLVNNIYPECIILEAANGVEALKQTLSKYLT